MRRHSLVQVLSILSVFGLGMLALGLPSDGHADSRSMTVKRRNNYDAHVREREAKERREEFERKQEARAEKRAKRDEEYKQRRRNGGKTDDELDLEDFSRRSLGAACMYGTKGEVIYRPRGAVCKGDLVKPGMEDLEPRPAAPAPPAAKTRAPAPKPAVRPMTGKKARCVWMNGRIAFKPEGVDCYAQ